LSPLKGREIELNGIEWNGMEDEKAKINKE
jgi:hypothetical protein